MAGFALFIGFLTCFSISSTLGQLPVGPEDEQGLNLFPKGEKGDRGLKGPTAEPYLVRATVPLYVEQLLLSKFRQYSDLEIDIRRPHRELQ